jgi:hypothetical protein
MSPSRVSVIAAIVLAIAAAFGPTTALTRGGGGVGAGAIGAGAIGGMGGGAGGGGLPPSITEPGWGREFPQDCYQRRLVHTQRGARWRWGWVCP